MNKILISLLIAAAALAVTGCTIDPDGDPNTAYTMESPYRKDIKSIAVPIWRRGKEEYRRDIEIRLTEAIVKRIEADTPYKVTDKRSADTELTGTLRRVEQRVLSYHTGSGSAREIQMRMVVDFTCTDLRTGQEILDKKKFTATGEYILPAPFNEDFFQGSEAAVNKAAERIVEQLYAKW